MAYPNLPLPPIEEMGPALRALRDSHRVFAWHLANNGGNATDAAIAAEFTPRAAGQAGWRLRHRADIAAAVEEINDRSKAPLASMALAALQNVLNDPSHKGHMKAIEAALEMSGGDRKPARDGLSDEQLAARIMALALKYRLPVNDLLGPSVKLVPVKQIEEKAVEIDPEIAELL